MTNRTDDNGRFITFEGGEGAGKSTQIRFLAAFLEQNGLQTIQTREPGGTPGAEAIRQLLVTGNPDRWDPTTEALLNTAARRDHVERVIRPAIEAGTWVLCDRYADSTLAYQGYAGGLAIDDLQALYKFAAGGLAPDLTVVMDIPVEQGLARAGKRLGDENRFESRADAFHEKVRNGFLDIARREPERCIVVDATEPKEQVTQRITEAVLSRFLEAG